MFASLMRFHVVPVRVGLDAICALRKLGAGSLRNTGGLHGSLMEPAGYRSRVNDRCVATNPIESSVSQETEGCRAREIPHDARDVIRGVAANLVSENSESVKAKGQDPFETA
jgi:hypothetical protein